MKEQIEIKGLTKNETNTGTQRKIIIYNRQKDAYKTYEYPHDKELTKVRIREFLDDFDVIFPAYLDIPEGEEEKNVQPK